jgi:hypothetical protein
MREIKFPCYEAIYKRKKYEVGAIDWTQQQGTMVMLLNYKYKGQDVLFWVSVKDIVLINSN